MSEVESRNAKIVPRIWRMVPVSVGDDMAQIFADHRVRAALDHRLRSQRGGEQTLDDVVVQVTGDAVPVLEHAQPLLVGARFGQLEGERRLLGERGCHVEIGRIERSARGDPTEDDGAA